MDRAVLILLSFLFSIFLYLLALYLLFFPIFNQPKVNKVEIKGSKVDIFLETPKKVKKITKPKKSISSSSKSKGSTGLKRVNTPNINKLFSSIDGKIYSKKSSLVKPNLTPSRLKSKKSFKAKNILKELSDLNINSSKTAIKSQNGLKDKYLSKVYEILYSRWHPSKFSAGYMAKVNIFIDKYGKFSYKILLPSDSEAFNIELKRYLEELKLIQFPKPKNVKSYIVKFEAKE